jgi:hypothetical protein
MGMAFFGFLNIYCLRVDLSVALVAMVKSRDLSGGNNNTIDAIVNDTVDAHHTSAGDCVGTSKSKSNDVLQVVQHIFGVHAINHSITLSLGLSP